MLRTVYESHGEVGYQGLRYDTIAARARTSKVTLYRHWPTEAGLVTAAVAACWPSVSPVPDAGSLRGDMKAYFSMLAEQVNGREGSVLAGRGNEQRLRAGGATTAAAHARATARPHHSCPRRSEVNCRSAPAPTSSRSPHPPSSSAPRCAGCPSTRFVEHFVDDIPGSAWCGSPCPGPSRPRAAAASTPTAAETG
ncbi:TetR/AcrR family transcriptional regulator [Streptomyces ipomoeae]|nr:TetR/AcrR family transcriptional regulator [Streptomyces ipomoeae]